MAIHHELEWHVSRCYLQGQGYNNDYQNKTVSISSELLILLQPNISLMVHHHMPQCLVKRLDLLFNFGIKVHNNNSKY